MPEVLPWVVGIVTTLAAGGLVGAVLTHRRETSATLTTTLSARLNEVEEDLKEQREWRRDQENRYSLLWAYARQLIDYAYRNRRDDAPELPDMPHGLN